MAKRGYPFECPSVALADGLDQSRTLNAYNAFPSRSSLSDLMSSNRPHAIRCSIAWGNGVTSH
jgi:hypothetical protein